VKPRSSCDDETATADTVGGGDAVRHLAHQTRDTPPWDAGTSLEGTVVVEWTGLAVLDGQREGDPGGGEGRHAGVQARTLVKGEAEHCDCLKEVVVVERV
jgi:hypothetical protein